jgi:predicted hotdog family 3-hydroxylacyl-ACP dehydratase
MLLLERVLAQRADGATCQGRIPVDSPFALGDRAPALVAIELAAQAAAAFEALGRQGSESPAGPRVGYLVSVRAARFTVHDLPLDSPLVAQVRSAGSAPPLAVYDVRVERDGREVMSATLGTYLAASGILGAP